MFLLLRKLAFILLICESFEISSEIFSSYLKDKLISGYYREEEVTCRVRCVYYCFVESMCFGVAYHKSSRMCYLYDGFPRCYGTTIVVDVGMETILPKDAFIKNIALHKSVNMSSLYGTGVACRGVDGLTDATTIHTKNSVPEWWCVDLEKIYNFQSIVVYNRIKGFRGRIKGFELRFSDAGECKFETFNVTTTCYKDNEPTGLDVYNITSCNQPNIFSSRFIFISLRSGHFLHFREMVVLGNIA